MINHHMNILMGYTRWWRDDTACPFTNAMCIIQLYEKDCLGHDFAMFLCDGVESYSLKGVDWFKYKPDNKI